MNLSRIAVVAIVLLSQPSSGQWLLRATGNKNALLGGHHQWSFRTIDEHGRNLAESYGRLYSDASCLGVTCGDGPICIELRDPNNPGDDQKLTIGDCSGPGWRLDSDGLFHSEADDNQCMQAGRDDPQDGTKIRMFGCDKNNELQKFVYEGQQLIKPISDLSLCVVWQGGTPDLNKDNVILKKCNHVTNRAAWSGDLPIEETPSGCANYQATVLARGHQTNNSYDPDSLLFNNDHDATYVTQVKSTDDLFDGFNTLGYVKCNQAAYLTFPDMPSLSDGDEWGITCTAILLIQGKSDGSMSQLVATGLAGGLFGKLENSPFADLGMPIVGGSGPFLGAMGTVAVDLGSTVPVQDGGCEVGTCKELTWKINLCGV